MTLTHRVALITGGKRIGAVIARRFAEAGADVALVYNKSRDEAEDTATAIRALGRRALTVRADLASPPDCARASGEASTSVRPASSPTACRVGSCPRPPESRWPSS